jgi:two-component system LytT family sensor kinase
VNDLLASPVAIVLFLALLIGSIAVAVFYFLRNRRNTYANPLERATFGTLHTVALASPSLREGLSPSSASFALPYLPAARHLRAHHDRRPRQHAGLDGGAGPHEPDVRSLADQVIPPDASRCLSHSAIVCERGDCPVRGIVVVPSRATGRSSERSAVTPPRQRAGDPAGHRRGVRALRLQPA